MSKVRTRFAPSPTGHLHVGGARTALFNYLFARHHGGEFILRIEDTDLERNTEESLEGILDALEWLGLEWDEGPFFQSQRVEIYRDQVDLLLASGRAYRCYCTPEELEQMRAEARAKGMPPRYNRRCLHMSEEERRAKEEANTPHVIRFRAEDTGELVVRDLIRGDVRFQNDVVDDFVIWKSNGMPTYQLAVVVDDALMKITHVIRGEEHLSNTPKQLQLYHALGLEPPQFAHIPLILAPDRSKLSKRHGAVWVGQFRDEGYLPEAIINYLALLGWALDDKTEFFTLEELEQYFTLEGVSKHSAVFDYKKFIWMNSVYIRELSPEDFFERASAYLKQARAIPEDLSPDGHEKLKKILALLQVRVRTLQELKQQVSYFFNDEIEFDPKAVKKFLDRPYVLDLYSQLLEAFIDMEPFSAENIEAAFERARETFGLSLGDVIQPVRVAVTGSTVSPPMYDTLELLGRAKTCERIRSAAAMVKQRKQNSSEQEGA